MKGKYAILLSLMVLSLLFTFTAVLAEEETVKIKFYFLESGSCLVQRGALTNLLWQGVGDGALLLSGKADGEYYLQPVGDPQGGVLKGYMMDNLAAGGCFLLKWTEADNNKHWVSVILYSTATSKGVYHNYYNDDPHVWGSISLASANPDDYIKFKGIYYDGTKIQKISGIALLMIIQYTEEVYIVAMQLLSGPQPIEQNSMILAIWSNIEYQEIPAAQVFRWNVEIKP